MQLFCDCEQQHRLWWSNWSSQYKRTSACLHIRVLPPVCAFNIFIWNIFHRSTNVYRLHTTVAVFRWEMTGIEWVNQLSGSTTDRARQARRNKHTTDTLRHTLMYNGIQAMVYTTVRYVTSRTSRFSLLYTHHLYCSASLPVSAAAASASAAW